jgi:hypothetical protein
MSAAFGARMKTALPDQSFVLPPRDQMIDISVSTIRYNLQLYLDCLCPGPWLGFRPGLLKFPSVLPSLKLDKARGPYSS